MRKPILALIAFVVLTGCNRKPKLEGKISGFKPGSTSVVLVHAKATKGSRVWCSEGGFPCEPFDMPASGERDVEVDLSKGHFDTPKKVMLTATYKDKNEEKVPLDLASGLPPALEVSGGTVSCPPRECFGSIDLLASSASVTVPPGTTLEIGTTKLTANAQGKAEGSVKLPVAPKELLLSKVCDDKSTLGTIPVSITFADGAKSSASLTFEMEELRTKLLRTLEGVKKGPVPFAWEKGGERGKPSALVHKGSFCYAGGASNATLDDLRVVVFTEEKAKREAKCAYAFNDGTTGSADITMHDQQATAYDRATGRVVGTKLFMAPKDCDREVTTKTKDLKDQDAWPDGKAVAAWAATLVR